MNASRFRFCPQCAAPLQSQEHGGLSRLACAADGCGYVHWDNPTPVVAAVVEHEGHIILARNKLWPVSFYALITGFLERSDTSPEDAVQREVTEELGLQAQGANFIGHYSFAKQNQVILAFHVPATGTIVLGDELADYKRIAPQRARYWPAATGLALRDWLVGRGYQPEAMELPKL
ncbi:MAG: NUDIX domain-containing protein [Burkholderiales bacterium]|nr:NUDIX domain-containing protein [Burkholderiales bacterium]MDE2433321.1 NUDIX domain-containing protein [Burkholderiales bacterium]HET8694754.1 NUDIX domain-containing protein [Aquabacterium sp.]